MTLTTYKWSIEQWHQLVETGVLADRDVELIDGEIVEINPEGIPHRQTNHRIVKYGCKLLDNKAEVYEAHQVTLDNSEPQPDIAIVKSPDTLYDDHHPYPEDIYLLVEISKSTLQIDKTTKAQVYARNKIQEYWIVDLVNKNLIVHTQPKGNIYQNIQEYQTGTVCFQVFPKIAIALDKLLLF